MLINNAGIMVPEDLRSETVDLAIAAATIATHLLGTICLPIALLSVKPVLQAAERIDWRNCRAA